ncbi:hypothetical protein PF010_g18352 [Phytophthora fragariae]|uniref:Uncharacterized protein n=1 Tax=Phytophthora fragariae TaxID=53985 RepID=A0A6G0KL97_9STRA|nr:hypothetical protein PF010_g18352 [Phytophthora fragariae]
MTSRDGSPLPSTIGFSRPTESWKTLWGKKACNGFVAQSSHAEAAAAKIGWADEEVHRRRRPMDAGYAGDEDEKAGADVRGTLKYLEAAGRVTSSGGEHSVGSRDFMFWPMAGRNVVAPWGLVHTAKAGPVQFRPVAHTSQSSSEQTSSTLRRQ